MVLALWVGVALATEPDVTPLATTDEPTEPAPLQGTATSPTTDTPDAAPAPAPAASPMTCPPWLQDAPLTVCTPAPPSTVSEDMVRIRRALDLSTAGVTLEAVALPLYLGFAGVSAQLSGSSLVTALPASVGSGAGTLMSAFGLERARVLLAEHHVKVPRAPLIVGSVLGGLGFALEAGGAIAWGGLEDPGSGLTLAVVGAGLHTGSITAFSVGTARARRAFTLLKASEAPAAASTRPRVYVAPHVDVASGTIGVAGVW